ncbi:hypothetical protein [Nisaea denitrificans]|uniref:hypothetical protein n=1 Tax=Nisaea denitrificans TaxID=390877 RepID=UPI000422A7F9|nr:hypothetical protein [Nisaea denitrificans]
MSDAQGAGRHDHEPWFARMIEALEEQARAQQTITYAELAVAAGIAGRYRIHRLTEALEDLTARDHRIGQPLRAAAAISKARDGLPGPGFFQHCAKLGLYFGPDHGPQAETFHRLELNRLFVRFG